MRISDFMKDYDKLRRGYVTSTIFFRALDLCGFKFNEAESLVLRKRYMHVHQSIPVWDSPYF